MTHARQSDINVSYFDRMVHRIDEAYEYYKADGKVISNVFPIPIKKNEKKPDAPRVYEVGPDGKDTVAEGTRLTPDEARRRIQNGGNIGIIVIIDQPRTSQNRHKYSLAFLDFDVEEGKTIVPEENIVKFIQKLNLFAYRTRNGGYRVVIVNDGRWDNAQIGYEGKKAGDILAWKKYTIAPGSYIPKDENGTPDATGYYEIYNDAPIRVVENADLPDWFQFREELTPIQKHAIQTLHVDLSSNPTDNQHWKSEFGLTVEDARGRDNELDELMDGPIGGRWNDRSTADFAVISKLLFYGFTEQQTAEILRYYRPYEKTMREDYLSRSIAKLVGGDKWKSPIEKAKILPTIIEGVEVEEVDKLPDELPIDKLINIIIGPPRGGKSRWGLTQIAKRGGGNYVAPNHTIIEQQYNTLKEIAPHLTSVWLAGKDRCCVQITEGGERMDCMRCQFRPVHVYRSDDDIGGSLTIENYEDLAYKALRHLKHLDVETVKNEYFEVCPYFLLHYAEKIADVCFTVPHFVCSKDKVTQVTPRAIMVLDEDTTFRHFLPESVEIFEFGKFAQSTIIQAFTGDILKRLGGLVEMIEAKDRLPRWDRIIMEIIGTYRLMDEIFEEFQNDPWKGARTTSEVKENLIQRIKSIDMVFMRDTTRDEKFEILDKLTDYERELHTEFIGLFEPMMFPYKDNPFAWIGTNPGKLYIVGDQMQIIRRPCESDQYVMIGFTEARLFAKTFVNDLVDRSPHLHTIVNKNKRIGLWNKNQQPLDESQQKLALKFRKFKSAKAVNMDTPAPHRAFQADLDYVSANASLIKEWRCMKFPYMNNFNVFKLMGTLKEQTRLLWHIIKILLENNTSGDWKTPALILTSSKEHQSQLWDALAKSGEVHMTRIEEIQRTKQIQTLGMISVFYQNSTISRGVDVPWHDVLFVHSTNFAQPYWNARLQYYSDQKLMFLTLLGRRRSDGVSFYVNFDEIKSKMTPDEMENEFRIAKNEYEWTQSIQRSLLSDETTNGALRISPTPKVGARHQKVLIVRDHDYALINPTFTSDMKTLDVKVGMDLNLVVVDIAKISKSTNPSAMFTFVDQSVEIKTDHSLYNISTLADISRDNLVSDGLFIGDLNPELEILSSTSSELKTSAEEKIEDLMEYLYRSVINTTDRWRSEEKIIYFYRTHASKARSRIPKADLIAALRKLEQAGHILRKERKDKIMYKTTGKDYVRTPAPVKVPLAEQKPKMIAKMDGDPDW